MIDVLAETLKHIYTVRRYLARVLADLTERLINHDDTKLESPEWETFQRVTPQLAACTYGSDKYKAFLAEMKPALEHHYAAHRHHPEHFEDGMLDMNMLDMIEMLCDWKAASERHNDGCVWRSIEINQKRFGYGDELKRVFRNSAEYMWGPQIG